MFRRVILESWHEYVPYICFALIAGVFFVVVLRALRMKKSDVDHLASLPLQSDEDLIEGATPPTPPSTPPIPTTFKHEQ